MMHVIDVPLHIKYSLWGGVVGAADNRCFILLKFNKNPEEPFSNTENRLSLRKYSPKKIKVYIHCYKEPLYICE